MKEKTIEETSIAYFLDTIKLLMKLNLSEEHSKALIKNVSSFGATWQKEQYSKVLYTKEEIIELLVNHIEYVISTNIHNVDSEI